MTRDYMYVRSAKTDLLYVSLSLTALCTHATLIQLLPYTSAYGIRTGTGRSTGNQGKSFIN